MFALGLVLVVMRPASATTELAQLDAVLITGSLTGNAFPVVFSFDGSKIGASGFDYITLNTVAFSLDGIAFDKTNLTAGGQVIFHDGVFDNFFASFAEPPLGSPVENITFGFGGPGVIGYTDNQGNFGSGSFSLVPEPRTGGALLLIGVLVGAGNLFARKRSRLQFPSGCKPRV